LAALSRELGVMGGEGSERIDHILESQDRLLHDLRSVVLVPNAETQAKLSSMGTAGLLKPTTGEELLRRPEIEIHQMREFGFVNLADSHMNDRAVVEAVEIEVKYAGYISRQGEIIEQTRKLEDLKLPKDLVYDTVRGLSTEEIEKLGRIRPMTLGQAQRISGVNPSAIQALLVHMKGRRKIKEMILEQGQPD
jgi:tRNA uridine 5-carboxymethylaminomethyl modification enzyme